MAENRTVQNKQPEMNFSFWRFLIWGTILTILFSYIFGSFSVKDRVTIPYSVFKEQVRDGNIRVMKSWEISRGNTLVLILYRMAILIR